MAFDNLISLTFSENDLTTIDQAIQTIEAVLSGKQSTLLPSRDSSTEELQSKTSFL